ncbi:MAG: hypothetical protein ISF22_06110 [Methanomassiliicoccus sp.]|nr:hypothetical protein [Methanomassiliicoccus sp.]
MNGKTMIMAMGVAAVLLFAGLAAAFGSTTIQDLLNTNDGERTLDNADDSSDETGPSANTNDEDTNTEPVVNDLTEPVRTPNLLPTPAPIPTPTPTPTPAPVVEGEPRLWMEYTTNWGGDAIQYGMPSPYSNRFTIETNEYGRDQPSGSYDITHFIHISDVKPRSGNIGDPEGTVEIRTHNPNSQVSRLVNLYDDGQGGCYGILVDTFATWDYTWTYENGKTAMFTQTFSINITKLGTHTIDVYAIHDHGDGTYKEVSNHLTRTFTTNGNSVMDPKITDRLGNYPSTSYIRNSPVDFRVTVQRGTYESNIHGQLPYAYSHNVKAQLFIEGTSGYSLSMNGNVLSGVSTTQMIWGTTYVGTMFELGDLNAGTLSSAIYDLTITLTDGNSHQVIVVVTDVPSGQMVGSESVGFYLRR